MAAGPAGRSRLGRRVRERAARRVHDHEIVVAPPQRTRRVGARSRGCACPTTGSRSGSPASTSPIAATLPAPATGRRGAMSGRWSCSASSTASATGKPRCRECAARTRRCRGTARRARSSRPAPATTWRPRSRWVPTRAGPHDVWWCRSARRERSSRRAPRRRPTRRVGCRLRRRDRSLPSARVHGQRHEGHRRNGAMVRRRFGDARRHGAGDAGRCRRCGPRAVSRRRAHTQSSRRHRVDRGSALRHRAAAARTGRLRRCDVWLARRARCAARVRCGAPRRDRADRRRCRVACLPAGGRRPRAGTGRRAGRVEHVACGAAVQAAAVLHGTDAAAVAAAWSLDRGVVTEPSIDADRAAQVRDRYRAAAHAPGVV